MQGLKGFLNPFPYPLGGYPHIFRAEADILLDHRAYDLIIGILKYHAGFLPDGKSILFLGGVASVHQDITPCRIEYCIYVLCESGFAGAVSPENGDELAFFHRQIYTINSPGDGRHIALIITAYIIKAKIMCLNDSHAFIRTPSSYSNLLSHSRDTASHFLRPEPALLEFFDYGRKLFVNDIIIKLAGARVTVSPSAIGQAYSAYIDI